MLFKKHKDETKPTIPTLSPEGRTIARHLARIANPMLQPADRIRAYEELSEGWSTGLSLDDCMRAGRDLYARCSIGSTGREIWWGIERELAALRQNPDHASRLPAPYQWLEAVGWWSPAGETLPEARPVERPSPARVRALLHAAAPRMVN